MLKSMFAIACTSLSNRTSIQKKRPESQHFSRFQGAGRCRNRTQNRRQNGRFYLPLLHYFPPALQKLLMNMLGFLRSDCFRLVDAQPLHEPGEFFLAEVANLFCLSGPLMAAIRKSLVQQHEAIRFPQQCFYPVATFPTEQEQTTAARIHVVVLLHDGCQAIDPAPHICVATNNVDGLCLPNISEH